MSTLDTRRGWTLDTLAALALGVFAFGFRLLSLRNLSNDHFMHMVWSQQLLGGDLPGRDFLDPGMPMAIVLSAGAQWLSPGPFSEAVLSIALLAVACAATTLLTARLTRSTTAGVLAGLFAVGLFTRLYGYPKVLVPAVSLLLCYAYAASPGTRRLFALALWLAIGAMLRHDLGVYAAAAVPVVLAITHWGDLRGMGRAAATFAGLLILVAIPYTVYIQLTEGVGEHLRIGAEFAKTDAHQILLAEFPTFEWLEQGTVSAWTRLDSATALFYLARLLPFAGLVLLVAGRRSVSRPVAATVAGALVVLALFDVGILRHPVESRVRDIAAPLAVVALWMCADLVRRARAPRPGGLALAGGVVAVVVAAGSAAATWHAGNLSERWDDTRIADGWEKVGESLGEVKRTGTVWPWSDFWPQNELPAVIPWLDECFDPSDRMLITWFGPEYYFFARRAFGGGQGFLYPGRAFDGLGDQQAMVTRMEQDEVRVVLINEDRGSIAALPLVQAYIQDRFLPIGSFRMYDDTEVVIAVDRQLTARASWGAEGWPCQFVGREALARGGPGPRP